MIRLIKYSIPIKKKAAMLDWLFGYKKIIIIVDTFECKMVLFCHGQYVGDSYGEIIKLPNMVSSAENHFRYQIPCKFYFAHELQNSTECKAKWLDAIIKHSKSGHQIRHGHEVLLPASVQIEKLLIDFDLDGGKQ
jgi:hypothetical protein